MHFLTLVTRNVTRRRLRTGLTVVAMAVAIGTVVALVGIADGFKASFMDAYLGSGIDAVVVRAGVQERINSGMDVNLADQIRKVSGVTDVTPSLLDVISFEQEGLYSVPLKGLEPGSRLLDECRVFEGRSLEPGDDHNVIIGRVLAENLHKKLGDPIELYGQNDYKIVGIFDAHSIFDDGSVVMLLSVLQKLMDRPGQVTGFAVSLAQRDDPKLLERATKDIEAIGPEISAMSVKDHVDGITQIRAAQGMAWLTAVIGLLIGAIGVLNTMFMSVLERTREIGILRAIGWRKIRVVRMILAESLLMSLLGAVAGTAGAIVLTKLLSRMPQINGVLEGKISWAVLAEGWGLAVLVGLIGAAYPAYRSAQLLPTEALRHD